VDNVCRSAFPFILLSFLRALISFSFLTCSIHLLNSPRLSDFRVFRLVFDRSSFPVAFGLGQVRAGLCRGLWYRMVWFWMWRLGGIQSQTRQYHWNVEFSVEFVNCMVFANPFLASDLEFSCIAGWQPPTYQHKNKRHRTRRSRRN
jgi:hypothetical protein